jgi:2-oxo-4-hydroxy-4-carboxy-5-ureidoimidazoline decarboxylase
MTGTVITLDQLNALDDQAFVKALDGLYEKAPWVAAGAAASRPFATVGDLHDGLMRAVRQKPREALVAFLNAHPVLGGRDARAGTLTAESTQEQAGLGLTALPGDEARLLEELNARYQAKFGFPFLICARRHTRPSILRALQERLEHSLEQELANALAEVEHIGRLRLVDRVTGAGMPNVAGRLSTHVLDTHSGRPAENVKIELFECGHSRPVRLVEAITNGEGRTDHPLLASGPLRMGTYELVFHMGAYYRRRGAIATSQPFLDEVCVRFGVNEPEGHYHVPLVVTPWSYATYRGS